MKHDGITLSFVPNLHNVKFQNKMVGTNKTLVILRMDLDALVKKVEFMAKKFDKINDGDFRFAHTLLFLIRSLDCGSRNLEREQFSHVTHVQ